MKLPLCLALVLLPVCLRAEGEAQLREAMSALAQTSHTWETTTRQRFRDTMTQPRPDAKADLAVRGKYEPDGYMEITQLPSRELVVPVRAVFHKGDVVASTPEGWRHRNDLRVLPNGDRDVTIEGQKVRLSRFYRAALKVTAMRALTEELFDLMPEFKSCRIAEGGLIVAELREATIEQWWGDAQARRAPEVHGTVIFKLGSQGLAEYHVLLGIGFPDSRSKTVAWTMQQWSTRISGIGTTSVSAPSEAVQALE